MINGANINGPGVVVEVVDRRRDMACFDALPKVLRDALNDAVIEYAVTPIAERIVAAWDPDWEVRCILAEIAEDNRRRLARRDRVISSALAA